MFPWLKKFLGLTLSSVLSLLAFTTIANAQGIANFGDITAFAPQAFSDLGQLLTVLIQAVIILGGLLFFIYLLVGGLQWITSGGDKAGLEAARAKIISATVGLLILVGAFAIITLVEVVLGIRIVSGIKIPGPGN